MLPFECVLCRSKQTLGAICPPCRADLDSLRLGDCCRWCAAPASAPVCGECLKRPPFFDEVIAPFIYRQPLALLIQIFKYGGGWQLAKSLAECMPPAPPADVVVPVPLYRRRERERGFNQARELIRRLGLRCADDVVQRIVNTPPQAGMANAGERRRNVRGAFRVGDVRGKSVLLVDDVMTTGATLNEIARVLKEAGADKVTAFVVARAAAAP